ncbi:MAG TPA: hypothetical protein VNR64_14160 [Vicinamibacterales bacterium]|nr:hypothetical protein [Vicinamibacterales bacterium]
MEHRSDLQVREAAAVWLAGLALAILMTWPLAAGLGRLGRTTGADGQFSLWNVAWVSRTLIANPSGLFDANIFYPHKTTLAYSEANLLEGAAGIPVWWSTRNPYATLNVVVLLAFTTSFACMYFLARRLSGSRPGAALAGMLYAFCPYVFSHTPHIQLLATAGLPLSMLMLDKAVESPSPGRGLALGLALVAQTLSCAYYGIFAALMVAFGALVFAATRGLWRSRTFWVSLAIGAAVAIGFVLPVFAQYLRVQSETEFGRTIADAARWSATPQDYIVSSAHAHAWLLAIARRFEHWQEVLFPGFLAVVLGLAGLVICARRGAERRDRETALLYGSLGGLALWSSFGPSAGLYRLLFHLPLFSFLRAPSRFGLVVVFALAVLAAFAVRALVERRPRAPRRLAPAVLAAAAIADLNVLPFPWERAPVVPSPYRVLAALPRAPVAEFPFYGERIAFPLHTQYMLFSTAHWMPLVNGYSDLIPLDFRESAAVLSAFPTNDAFAVLAHHRVRYIGVHWDMYGPRAGETRRALERYAPNLRVLAADARMTLYEVVRYP